MTSAANRGLSPCLCRARGRYYLVVTSSRRSRPLASELTLRTSGALLALLALAASLSAASGSGIVPATIASMLVVTLDGALEHAAAVAPTQSPPSRRARSSDASGSHPDASGSHLGAWWLLNLPPPTV